MFKKLIIVLILGISLHSFDKESVNLSSEEEIGDPHVVIEIPKA